MEKTKKSSHWKIIGLFVVVAIIITAAATILAVNLSNTADPLVTLNAPTNGSRIVDITKDDYNNLINDKKSFVIMVDNPGCTTTARMREMLENLPEDERFSYYRIMWQDAMETGLYEYIKYFPSLAIVQEGQIKYYLQADSDDDATYYNDQSALESWLKSRINFGHKQ